MKILIPLLIAALLFTHCCFEGQEIDYYRKYPGDDRWNVKDLEIDPDLWERHVFPEGGE